MSGWNDIFLNATLVFRCTNSKFETLVEEIKDLQIELEAYLSSNFTTKILIKTQSS
jgi:hypothetical protein